MADFALTTDELRAVTGYAWACAEPTIWLFTDDHPDDPRPQAALDAARAFADGAPRSTLQRTAAADAHRAAKDATTDAARHAAVAAGDAAAAAYLQPLADENQLRHVLGAAVHAARAGELSRGDDAVVGEYLLVGAAARMPDVVRDVLSRYPRAPEGRDRVGVLLHRLDHLLRDPAPPPRPVDDPGPFFHGTRVDVRPGDLLSPGHATNYGSGKVSRHIYVTASSHAAPLAAVLARGDGPPRVYRVEPLGPLEDDPNVTDKRFPGNPTRSYRTKAALRVVEEVVGWEPPPEETVRTIRENTGTLARLGIEAMD